MEQDTDDEAQAAEALMQSARYTAFIAPTNHKHMGVHTTSISAKVAV